MVKDAFNQSAKTEEFKKCAKAMKDNNIFNLTASSLYKDIDKEVTTRGNGDLIINIDIYNEDISQDIGYYEYEPNKLMLHITDNAFKSIKNKIESELGASTFIGDDFYGYSIWIPIGINEKDAELVELN